MRINKAIELLSEHQPVYFEFVDSFSAGGFEGGRALAQTWADYIAYDMEHSAFDVPALLQFTQGLAAGGRTASGHRTPAVIVTLPIAGSDEYSVRANAWMIQQTLAAGVHGLLLCHAESAAAVSAFVAAARYAFASESARRGHGGQTRAAEIWGVEVSEYFQRADCWPLNPRGELMLGIKVENTRALGNVEQTTRVPGLAFAEWGPGDMGMSMGYPDQHDEPYPAEMRTARSRVMAACKAAGLAFLEQVTPQNVIGQIEAGVMIGAGPQGKEAAEIGRKHTSRKPPW